ncbi:MAG TPA: hypothetical protein VMR70_07395 [Flavisolibacter sp.]|nr:hypothetical protein [Flavisolibacter sp.]
MKRIVLLGIVSMCFLVNAEAQTKPAKKSAVKKTAAKAAKTKKAVTKDTAVVLTSTTTNAAYAPAANGRLQIADPTVNTLNLRSAGAPLPTDAKPIIGMPKATYGIANGRILLRSTTSATPGTAYGSGAVGTGTSISGVGTSEATIGVNGKSPYAGPWLWGDRRPAYPVAVGDSTRRQ